MSVFEAICLLLAFGVALVLSAIARRIWPDHRHKWVILNRIAVFSPADQGPGALPIRFDNTLQCETCGNLKTVQT